MSQPVLQVSDKSQLVTDCAEYAPAPSIFAPKTVGDVFRTIQEVEDEETDAFHNFVKVGEKSAVEAALECQPAMLVPATTMDTMDVSSQRI